MPHGSLKLHVIDLVDDGVAGDVRLDLRRAEGGSAGAGVTATFPLAGEAHLELEDIPCQSGYGTTYTVAVTTKHFRRFAFNQLIRRTGQTGPTNLHSDWWLNPRLCRTSRRRRSRSCPPGDGRTSARHRCWLTRRKMGIWSDSLAHSCTAPLDHCARRACSTSMRKPAMPRPTDAGVSSARRWCYARIDASA